MRWDMRGAYPLMRFNEEIMNTLLRFKFVAVDGMDTNVDIFVLTYAMTNDKKNEIEDAISSYINSVEDWQYEELVNDILASFDLDYKIVSPITYEI